MRAGLLGVLWGRGSRRRISPYVGFVATNTAIPDARSGTLRQYNARSHHIARDTIVNPSVIFPNWFYDRRGTKLETASAGTATITASIEYPAGVFTQLLFDGNTSKVIASGDNGIGTATVTIPEGADFWVREYRVGSSGVTFVDSFEKDSSDTANGEAFEYSTGVLTDKTMSGTITNTAASAPRAQGRPVGIIATTSKRSYVLYGDSLTRAEGDTFNANGDCGILARSVGKTAGYTLCGSSAQRLELFNTAGYHERQVALAQYCTDVISAYAFNDINSSLSAATVKALLDEFWAKFPTKTIHQTTITPRSTSTDNWATVGNQTTAATNAVRIEVNNYIKSLPAPLAGYYDVANVIDNAPDAGVWKADGTAFKWCIDGIHPSFYGYEQVENSGIISV